MQARSSVAVSSTFMEHARRVGPTLLDGKPVGTFDRLKYKLGNLLVYGPLKNTLGLSRMRVGYTAGEAIGPEIFDFYRSAGHQSQAALRSDRGQRLHHPCNPMARCVPIPSACRAPGVELSIGDNGEVYYSSPGVFVNTTTRTPKARLIDQRCRRLGGDRAMPALSRKAQDICGSSTVPRMSAKWPTVACSRRNMSRTS
jgi:hypothetical protein